MIWLYATVLVSGTAYLIECHGWSPWWILMMILLLPYRETETKQTKPKLNVYMKRDSKAGQE